MNINILNRIIDFSVKYKFFVLFCFTFVVFVGTTLIKKLPIDAIPDLSDTQVIIYVKWNKNPKIIEEQITYPIITSLLGIPRVKSIRGFSDYGYSFIYVIFKDSTDIYWARSRIIEYLDRIKSQLPKDATIELGPDASGVGWVFQYVLISKDNKLSLDEIRSYHDFNIKYQLQSIEGVSEVATIGGFEKEYQIIVDPDKLFIYGISVLDIIDAIRKSNNESDAKILEYSGFEYMIRIGGYLKDIEDIKSISLRSKNGSYVKISDIANVVIIPQMRRGAGDFNGLGETVSGIVIARHNENAYDVIMRVKEKINEIRKNLPYDLDIITVYDRSILIKETVKTLKTKLIEEFIIVSFVILIFLWHIPSAIVAIMTIPVSIIICFIFMYLLGISSNIMSISGIAISIGILVDGAIIEVENAYKKLELWNESGRAGDFNKIRLEAIKEVIPSVFFSLLVVAISFIPIFCLEGQEGKLFSPLAWTKTLTMLAAALCAVSLDPALRMSFSRMEYFYFKPKFISNILNFFLVGKYYREEDHPISKFLNKIYTPIFNLAIKRPKKIIALSILAILSTVPIYFKLGREFMPPLNEGTILYMPTTLPNISIEEAKKILIEQDRILKSFPEVLTVYGKAGRANTATDPAPLSMVETIIVLKKQSEWREKVRWYSSWAPQWFKKVLRHIWYDRITLDELVAEMDSKMRFLGFANAWTMPIKGRIDMLSTGIKTPLGIKIFGDNIEQTQDIALKIEKMLKNLSYVRSVYAERVIEGYFISIEPIRENLARYNITLSEFQEIVSNTIGSMPITYVIHGRERYPLSIRYGKFVRQNIEDIKNLSISFKADLHIPLSEVAEVRFMKSPSMIRDEDGFYATYVYVDFNSDDIGGYSEKIKKYIEENIKLPSGLSIIYSGQYENIVRVKERMKLIIPVVVFLVFLLIYLNTNSVFKTVLVISAVPFSLIGAFWLLYILDYNLSVAVWVGIIALAGLDAETGMFMLMYLELAYKDYKLKYNKLSDELIRDMIYCGAVKRLRPKLMTVTAAFMGLLPIMWSNGTGSDVMKRIAAPMIGGLFTSFIMELIVYPVIWYIYVKKKEIK